MSSKQTVIDQETGEVLEVVKGENLPARNNYNGVVIGGNAFEVVGLVNVPTLKHESGTTIAIQILMPIVKGMNEIEEEGRDSDGNKVKFVREVPINVVRVRSLADGLTYEYVLNAISADALNSAYPQDSYVDKYFAIRKGDVVKGKRYKEVEVIEIRPAT